MMKADGTRANSALEDRQVIMEYFSKVFKATLTTFTDAVSRDRAARLVEAFEKDLTDIDSGVMPNYVSLVVLLTRKKPKPTEKISEVVRSIVPTRTRWRKRKYIYR